MLEKKILFHEATRQVIKADKNTNWDLVNLTTPIGLKIINNEYIATVYSSIDNTMTFSGILSSKVLVNGCIEIAALKDGFVYGLEIENVSAGDKIKAGNGIFEKTTTDDYVAEVIEAKENNYCLVVAKKINEGGGAISKQAELWADYVFDFTKNLVTNGNNFTVLNGYFYGNAVVFDPKDFRIIRIDEIIDYDRVYGNALGFITYIMNYPEQLTLLLNVFADFMNYENELIEKIGLNKKLYVAMKFPYKENPTVGIYTQQANTEKIQSVQDWIDINSPSGVFLKLDADWGSYPLFKKEEIVFDTYTVVDTLNVYEEN